MNARTSTPFFFSGFRDLGSCRHARL